MRIQARIFLVFSLMVLAIVGVQVWLNIRQMKAVEHSLGGVATAVGRDLLRREIEVIGKLGLTHRVLTSGSGLGDREEAETEVRVEIIGEDDGLEQRIVERVIEGSRRPGRGEPVSVDGPLAETHELARVKTGGTGVWVANQGETSGLGEDAHVIYLEAYDDGAADGRILVVSNALGEAAHIPIPTKPTMRIFRDTLTQSLVASAILLLVGLGVSAIVSRRLARPLEALAAHAEALGRGGVGVRVPVTSSGEVGELEAAFDRMSTEMADLERQRETWRRREHLAQLGDLSRGLAHTIRNPLHTLGLAVEELAGDGDDPRVVTARTQIRRIDRWIRSFLALGAQDAAATTPCDLVELIDECLLEVPSCGVRIEAAQPRVQVRCVATGLRAALSNLLENAIQASPVGTPPVVGVALEGAEALITIRDRGPGIPAAVRQRLFEPHQTTRAGGAGMGLFLARQLVVGMHGGSLTVEDAEGGGTLVTVRIAAEGMS